MCKCCACASCDAITHEMTGHDDGAADIHGTSVTRANHTTILKSIPVWVGDGRIILLLAVTIYHDNGMG